MTTVIRQNNFGSQSFSGGQSSSSSVGSSGNNSGSVTPVASPQGMRRGEQQEPTRKPEVAEARAGLQKAMQGRNAQQVTDAVRRVIVYMTMGVDMSPLYSDMIMAINTRDITQKKLIYMFLCEYGRKHADMTVLAMNTLAKDCADPSPLVRGVAVRALGSFGLRSLLEYTVPLISTALDDVHPYVRRNAVFAVAKLLPLMDVDSSARLVGAVERLVGDSDAQVVLNALAALRESNAAYRPGPAVVAKLLAAMRDMDEFVQCQVLDWLAEIADGVSEQEALGLLNALDDRLQDNNSAIVLAVVKVFLRLTAANEQLHGEVLARVKGPLLLLVGTARAPELVYPLLCHLRLFLTRSPLLLEREFRSFFVKQNDPNYLRTIKIDLLTLVTTERNGALILDELAANATDPDPVCARAALHAIGAIALKLPQTLNAVVAHLAELLALGLDDAAHAGIVLVFRDLLRKYGAALAPTVVPHMRRALPHTDASPDAQAAVLWALGEYPDVAPDAPYLLESLADRWRDHPLPVRVQLLTAAVRVLLARPPEGAPAAGKALAAAAADRSSVELRDTAGAYYRLLEQSPELARSVVAAAPTPVSSFVEDETFALQDRLFDEFNTLSVCYGKPADERPHFAAKEVSGDEDEDEGEDGEDGDYEEEGQNGGDGAFDGAQTQAPQESEQAPLELVETPAWDAQSFQKAWGALPAGCVLKGTLAVGLSVEEFVPEIKANKQELCCIAAGIIKDTAKIYAYSQLRATGEYLLAEILLDKNTAAVQATFKSSNTEFLREWARLVCANYLGFDA